MNCVDCGVPLNGSTRCYTCWQAADFAEREASADRQQTSAKRIGWAANWIFLVGWGVLIASMLFFGGGCKGVQSQISVSALDIKPPPGMEASMPRVALGSFVLIHSQPQPDGEAGLNRFHLQTGGIEAKATVTSGPVGEQVEAMGGAEALGLLLQRESPATPLDDLPLADTTELGVTEAETVEPAE